MSFRPHVIREHVESDGYRECVVCGQKTIGEGVMLRHVGEPEPSAPALPGEVDYAYRDEAIAAVRERMKFGGDPAVAAVDALILGGYFRAKPLPLASRNTAPVGLDHPKTSHKAAAKTLPRTGTLRMAVLDLFVARGHAGLTADEVQATLHREHQSISPIITGLKSDGWIEPMGVVGGTMTRSTRLGNDAEVYVLSQQGRSALNNRQTVGRV